MQKNWRNDVAMFNKEASNEQKTYAQLQIEETVSMITPVRTPPEGYKKAGEKAEKKV